MKVKLLRSWKRLQVSYYGGAYSIHRLLALETYVKKTSLLRALLVCIGTPLPMATIIFIQESIPLRDVKDGWSASYGQWIRVTMLTFVITYSSTSPINYFLEGIHYSVRQLVLLSACVSVLLSACSMLISAYLIFPIPFSVLTMTPIYNIIYLISLRLVVGAEAIERTKAQPEQFKRFLNNLHAQVAMMFVYPIYEVLFRTAEGSHYQLLVILFLPVIKVFLKNIVRKSMMHAEDMVPEAVIFTVDFFNAIYTATCMQTSSSTLSIVLITVTDLSQTAAMLYGLHRRTATISSKLLVTTEGSSDREKKDLLLSVLSSICRDPVNFKKQNRAGLTIRSCLSHDLSTENAKLLDTLESTMKEHGTIQQQTKKSAAVVPYPTTTTNISSRGPSSYRFFCFRSREVSIQPTSDLLNMANPQTQQGKRPTTKKSCHKQDTSIGHPTFLRDSLEILFTIECLVVTAYLEAVIPLFYTAYILVMVHLPSAKYHSEMVGITPDNVEARILPVFTFGLLEIASLVVLVMLIRRNCMMRAIYHLAFVLESQRSLIQVKLIVWMMITLCFRVMHFGAL